MSLDKVLAEAQAAKDAGASRFCMGAAWREPKDRDLDKVCAMIEGVRAMGMETCVTLGMLNEAQAKRLKDSGLDYYNHNLDTSPEFYGDIITTRTYQERLDTLEHVRDAGIHVCCGGIAQSTGWTASGRSNFAGFAYCKGVHVALGSDWCSNDLWKFMRAAVLVPRVKTGDVGMMSGYDALKIATLGGAKALGMEDEIGSLEVGKKADIILVDVSTPWCMPIRTENLTSNIIYNVNGSDVTDVFVDGHPVMKERKVTTVDVAAVMKDCQMRADRIWKVHSKNWS